MDPQVVEGGKLQREMIHQGYSEKVIDHWFHPRNIGRMGSADGQANESYPFCESLWIWVKLRDGKITQASFLCNLCVESVASGSTLTEMVKGMTVDQARNITGTDLYQAMGCISPSLKRCAFLAVDTLKKALENIRQEEPEGIKKTQ